VSLTEALVSLLTTVPLEPAAAEEAGTVATSAVATTLAVSVGTSIATSAVAASTTAAAAGVVSSSAASTAASSAGGGGAGAIQMVGVVQGMANSRHGQPKQNTKQANNEQANLRKIAAASFSNVFKIS
jgi:hypothetical protein